MTWNERLQAIDWGGYRTAYGPAHDVSGQLARLASPDEAEALSAAGDLWAGLCHQHAYVSSAALPALPFLLEVLDRTSDPVRVEILDILLGFARCSHPTDVPPSPPWIQELRARLLAERPRLERLAEHPDEAVADFAGAVLDVLASSALTHLRRWGYEEGELP